MSLPGSRWALSSAGHIAGSGNPGNNEGNEVQHSGSSWRSSVLTHGKLSVNHEGPEVQQSNSAWRTPAPPPGSIGRVDAQLSTPSWRTSAVSTGSGGASEVQHCEVVCNMLAMLSCSEKLDAQRALLAMTNTPESCQSLRRAGCIPLLIQILHPGSSTPIDSHPSLDAKLRASKALKNIVRFNPDEQMKRKEMRILRLLEVIRAFSGATTPADQEKHPTSSSTTLMKLSFDLEHRNTMCTLGAIHALADLILTDHKVHGPLPADAECIMIRRYSCMTLTNLTFGDGVNKALLCSLNEFLSSLVAQLEIDNEDIVQVTASVLRNLSWHADSSSRDSLHDAQCVTGLMKAALRATKESTMKATLSALWNLSAHSDANKAAICKTPNALKFLLSLLRRNKSMTIVENAGGILRNASAYATGVEECRIILRECHCYEILLENLKSSSLTVVSNACGTLWNLSGHAEEQRILIDLNAAPMLKSLIYSKHEKISEGASAALHNILSFYNEHANDLRQRYDQDNDQPLDLTITSCKSSPVRKINPPPFLNPPLYNGSVSSTRSCPEIQVKQTKMESSSDETFNYSHYDEEEEEEKHQQKDTVKTYCDEGTPGFSGSMVDLSNQAVDTFIQFQVEDTPAVFSRTSSLSSIEENQHGENTAELLEAKKPSAINTTTASLPNAPVVPKRVMFSAEETPLMFSRCSSVASLESCGELNNGRCESDCVSDFSRRTSEVVSPSELPDSPRAGDQGVSPPEPPQDQQESGFIEVETGGTKAKPASSTNDEVKVFAMEGTPFLISTATSLSDIVGELDNQLGANIITDESAISHPVIQPPSRTPDPEPESEDPIYSDVQLLQKCIRAGRAVGINPLFKKPPVVEEEKVDLSCLIQRGRAKLLTRSEDNLKQYTTSALAKPLPQASSGFNFPAKTSTEQSFAPKQILGSLPSLNQNQRYQNINLNIVPPIIHETNDVTGNLQNGENVVESLTAATNALKLGNSLSPLSFSPNANSIISSPNGNDTDKTDSITTLSTVKQNFLVLPDDNDNTDTPSLSEETTWTDETPTFSSPIPSMSIGKAIKKVNAAVEETLSEIEQPTLDSMGTLDSGGLHTDSHQRLIHQKQQLLLLQTSSSQASNLMNQKPPPEFFDLDSSMISVASIKSEIFEDGIPSSPQLPASSSSQHQQYNAPQNANLASSNSASSPPGSIPVPVPTPPQSKFDTYVIKRLESPKDRRKNDPERYLTRTIEKADLKMKPPVPPKPSATTVVRPTRASELRATRSREHSPTNSTTSLNTAGSKVPPKPPVRSTPPLNTTLPRNAKLMEGYNSFNSTGISNSIDPLNNPLPPLPQQQPQAGKDAQSKLNFGGRIGNLFRKSFSKDGGKKKENIWVKRREKALVSPFNYKPPAESTTTNGNATPINNTPSSNTTTTTTTSSGGGNGKTSTKITTV